MSNELPHPLAALYVDPILEACPPEHREAYLEYLKTDETPEEKEARFEREAVEAQADAELEAEKYLNKLKEDKRRSPYFPADTIGAILSRDRIPRKAYIKDFLYAGALTVFAADPKAGKTTFALEALGGLTKGQVFLGEQLIPTVVLYATEQTEASLVDQADVVASLKDNDNFRVILYEDNTTIEDRLFRKEDGSSELRPTKVIPATWEKQIDLWTKAVEKNKAKVLVIDTFTAFSKFKGGESFDPGVVQDRLQELKILIARNPDLAIFLCHHLRKEPNDNKPGKQKKESERSFSDIANSYALLAGSDMNILYFRPSTNPEHKMVRTVKIQGRFIREELSYRLTLTPSGFVRSEVPGTKTEDKPKKEQDPQARLLDLCLKDPKVNTYSTNELIDTFGFKRHEVQTFRKTYPKGTQPPVGFGMPVQVVYTNS